jgi:hypothetical protein
MDTRSARLESELVPGPAPRRTREGARHTALAAKNQLEKREVRFKGRIEKNPCALGRGAKLSAIATPQMPLGDPAKDLGVRPPQES